MLKFASAAIALAAAIALGACTQGDMEESGEQIDNAREEATTGERNLGQGPAEEAGERADAAIEGTTTPGQAVDKALDSTADAAQDAADAIGDAAHDAASNVEKATDGNPNTKPD